MHFVMVLGTIVLFLSMVGVNEWIFKSLEFLPGIHWVYLPAGVRLLVTMLFGVWGAIGILLAGWWFNFTFQFPGDFSRAFMGGIISAVAPYLVYVMARRFVGLQSTLGNLTSGRLLLCIVVYSLTSPLMHHIWFALRDPVGHRWQSFWVMALGDFIGSLIVFYTLKVALVRLWPKKAPGTPPPRSE